MDWNGQKNGPNPQKAFEEFLQDFFDKPGLIVKIFLVAGALFAVLTSYYTVRVEEKAVVLRLGRYSQTQGSGLHFKIPFGIDRVILVPTNVQQEQFGARAMNTVSSRNSPLARFSRELPQAVQRGSDRNETLMLTGDLNIADVEWSVQYIVTDPRRYLFKATNPTKTIRDISQTTMRQVVGDRSINDILTVGRLDIQAQVRELMQKIADEYELGVSIDAVLLQDVSPPESVQPSFNQVNSALQQQKQQINLAEAERNERLEKAEGKRQREVSAALGYKVAVINRAQGETQRFLKTLKAYQESPQITRTRLYIEAVESVLKRVEGFTVVDPKIKGLLPIFSAGGRSSLSELAKSQADNTPSDRKLALKSGSHDEEL
ncbi:MAG: FtsH protease activity modulator HflK [Bdellovibrionales bacterium]|nr:FtsH protease activity modulator HflK [Bdellovibrionales bacterium]